MVKCGSGRPLSVSLVAWGAQEADVSSARAATRGAPRGYHTSAAIRAKSASKFSKWYKKC